MGSTTSSGGGQATSTGSGGTMASSGTSSGAPMTCAEVDGNVGCCVGNTNYFCKSAATMVSSKACAAGEVCTWIASDGYYACAAGTVMPDPSGVHPIACVFSSSSSSSSSSSGDGGVSCEQTCANSNMTAFKKFLGYQLQTCGCAAAAPCAATCTSDCAMPSMLLADETDPCGTCLGSQGGTPCTTSAGETCVSDSSCSPFVQCAIACP